MIIIAILGTFVIATHGHLDGRNHSKILHGLFSAVTIRFILFCKQN